MTSINQNPSEVVVGFTEAQQLRTRESEHKLRVQQLHIMQQQRDQLHRREAQTSAINDEFLVPERPENGFDKISAQENSVLSTAGCTAEGSKLTVGLLYSVVLTACCRVVLFSYTETKMGEFNLGETLEAVVTQGMSLSTERKVPLHHNVPSEICSRNLYGDNLRLQQVLAQFLFNALQFTPPSQGSVLLLVVPKQEQIGTKLQLVHLEFRSDASFILLMLSCN